MAADVVPTFTRQRWVRVAPLGGDTVRISVDGIAHLAHPDESVLSAVLAVRGQVRISDADGAPRAGFCLMGACQECWVWVVEGRQVRACGTPVEEGMAISTTPPRAACADA